ncbi:MAG: pirin family protein [Pyrinomonadaceae bacterium]
MIKIRKAKDRGHFNFGWLDTYHTFSFADYYDPSFMGFRDLRVINEDFVHGGRAFPTHSHRDMEIITYILDGALEHRDSMGNGSLIRPGDVQRMTAGTGVSHSEANPSSENSVHLLQIWIIPQKQGLKPGYEQKFFSKEQKEGRLCLIASGDRREGSVTVHQDISVYSAVVNNGQTLNHQMAPNRHAWIQVARGGVVVNGENLDQGDGAAVSGESELLIGVRQPAEFLLFDLA